MQRTRQDPTDLAYQLGVARALNEQYRGVLEREQAQQPARKRHWTQSFPVVVICCLVFAAVGVRFAPHIYGWWYGWEDGKARTEAMPTAAVTTPRPTPPSNDPPGPATSYSGGAPTQPAAPDPGIAAYNAAQQERAAQFATADAQPSATPAGASEAAIQAWLDGPVSTPTPAPERPLVEVVSEAAFDASFAPAECSPFVGYLAGDPCIEILKQQAGE